MGRRKKPVAQATPVVEAAVGGLVDALVDAINESLVEETEVVEAEPEVEAVEAEPEVEAVEAEPEVEAVEAEPEAVEAEPEAEPQTPPSAVRSRIEDPKAWCEAVKGLWAGR